MVKDRVDNEPELFDTEELIIERTVEDNPSLTLPFTMKVCLTSVSPLFLCFDIFSVIVRLKTFILLLESGCL